MPGLTDTHRVWEAWMDAFGLVRDALPGSRAVPCPSCGEGNVRVSYTGDPETRIGYAIAWCDVCLNGIYLSRVGVPDGVEMLSFEATEEERDAVVPDVRLIPPDPGLDDDVPGAAER